MAKKKRQKQSRTKKKASKRQRKRNNPQTNQPFEQDAKRRIGPFGGTGEPPIMR